MTTHPMIVEIDNLISDAIAHNALVLTGARMQAALADDSDVCPPDLVATGRVHAALRAARGTDWTPGEDALETLTEAQVVAALPTLKREAEALRRRLVKLSGLTCLRTHRPH